MQPKNFEILPGGMFSDVTETDLGPMRHQLLKNVRLSKDGEWEFLSNYSKIADLTNQLTDVKAAVHVVNDDTGDDFIIVQDGTTLKIIENNSSPATSITSLAAQMSDLGVTIGSGVTVRFTAFNGVVRVTGSSFPLWYGIIDRKLYYSDTESPLGTTNLITNGDFVNWTSDDPDDWFVATEDVDNYVEEFTGFGHQAHLVMDSGSNFYISQACLTAGFRYKLIINCTSITGSIKVSDGSGQTIGYVNSIGDNIFTFTAGHTILKLSEFENSDSYIDTIGLYQYVFQEKGYYLEDQRINAILSETDTTINEIVYSGTTNLSKYGNLIFGIFPIYDNGQYGLPEYLPEKYAIGETEAIQLILEFDFGGIGFRRLSGLGFLVAKLDSQFIQTDQINYNSLDWQIVEFYDLPIKDEYDYDSFLTLWCDSSRTPLGDTGHPGSHTIYFNSSVYTDPEAAALAVIQSIAKYAPGMPVNISRSTSNIDTTINQPAQLIYDTDHPVIEIYLDDDVTSVVPSSDRNNIIFKYRKVFFDESTGKINFVASYMEGIGYQRYRDLAGYNINAESINPNLTQFSITNGYGLGIVNETGEKNKVRYSPIYQPDVFPADQFIITKNDSISNINNIAEREDRLVLFKETSFSQIQFVQGKYYHDVGFDKIAVLNYKATALYKKNLFIMTLEDVEVFNGIDSVSFLKNHRIRAYYKAHVDADSYCEYDQNNKELRLYLSDVILIYNFEYDYFYTRQTQETPELFFISKSSLFNGQAPSNSIIDIDGNRDFLYINDPSVGISTSDAKIETAVFDSEFPEFYKKLEEVLSWAKGTTDFTITVSDMEESTDTANESKTVNSSDYKEMVPFEPNILFKRLLVEITASSSTMNLFLRKLRFVSGVFGNGE